MANPLCRLGLHKWRNYGKQVPIVWQEPGIIFGLKKTVRKNVFEERECLRCEVREKRLFSENIDGTRAAAGWERIAESEEHSR